MQSSAQFHLFDANSSALCINSECEVLGMFVLYSEVSFPVRVG
jgi:hypothetical protein